MALHHYVTSVNIKKLSWLVGYADVVNINNLRIKYNNNNLHGLMCEL